MASTIRGGGRKRDPMWKHGTLGAVAGEVICNHCRKTMTGGIYRLKIHLARISGQNIIVCDNCPEEVQREAKAKLSEFEQNKAKKKRTAEAMTAPTRNISSTESENFGVGSNTSADWIVEPDGATGDIDVDSFITDAQLDEMEREAVEWVAEVAEHEEAGDEFVDPEEADSSPIEDIAAAAATAATPSTSTPTQRQQSFLSFSRKRNL
ncbi:hypothetical protein SUGI_0185490 [Cryptomeria japonica]|nr:hypothetical protein SUGI_0185490 [Cryptomeria japonica]